MILTVEEFKTKFVPNPDSLFKNITDGEIESLLEVAENFVKIDFEVDSLQANLTFKTLVAYEALRNWYSTRVIKEEIQTYYTNKYKEVKDKISSIPMKFVEFDKSILDKIDEEVLNEQISN